MSFSRRRPNQHATRGCPTGRLLTCPNHAPTRASDGQWKAQRGLCHVVLQGWRGQDPGDAARQQRPLRHERSTVGLIRSTPTQGGGWAVAPGRHPITSSSKPHARGRRCLCLSSQDALTAFRPSALSSAGEGRVDIPLPLRGPPEGAQTLSWRRAKAFGCSSQPSGCLQPSHVGLAKPGAKAPRHGVVGLSELLSRFWGSKYVAGQQLPPALWVEVWAPGGPGAAL